jgi:trehalose 6-phosphate synthase/phosphatase
LDHDGTLVEFTPQADEASPSAALLHHLEILTGDLKNEVVIVSGRDKDILEQWYGAIPVALAAEHGAWLKLHHTERWRASEPLHSDWKPPVRSMLELFCDRTPGA